MPNHLQNKFCRQELCGDEAMRTPEAIRHSTLIKSWSLVHLYAVRIRSDRDLGSHLIYDKISMSVIIV